MDTIRLLVDGPGDRNRLEDWLSSTYRVVIGLTNSSSSEPAEDLVICDVPGFQKYQTDLRALKQAHKPVYLPVLLTVPRDHLSSVPQNIWENVDEVIPGPITQQEMQGRLSTLLRARKYSREANERYHTLAGQSPDGIVILQEGRLAYANAAFCKMSGRSKEVLSDTSFGMLIHPADRERVQTCLRKIEDGERDASVCEGRLQGGEKTRWIELHLTSTTYSEKFSLLGIARDITGRKRRERELRQAKEQAEEMNHLKSSFLSNMSHEIRTPITSIMGFTEVLAESADETDKECIDIIQKSSRRLLDTVESVLYLSQLESGSLELQPRSLDAAAHVQEMASRFREQARESGLDFSVETPDGGIPARMDTHVLEHLVTHLTDNAIKFTREGGVTVRISTAGEDTIVLEVEDTGIGLEVSEIDRLFEAFQQESTGHTREFEGTGLGLTIAKQLAQRAGGRIEVESKKREGTRFTVHLPRHTTDSTSETSPLSAAHKWGLSFLPSHQHVLIVEDDPHTCELVPQLLPESFEVDVSMNSASALAKAREQRYDIVLMDINLKETSDGVEVMKRMKDMDGYEDTLFIAVTAYARPGDGERFHEEGFDGYVAKPFRKATLYENLIQIRESANLHA